MNLQDVIAQWQAVGVFDVILPFLLVFSIFFAALQKIKILTDNKNVNVIVSFVIALLVVRNENIVGLMTRFLPNVSMFLVIILMFLLMIGIFAGEQKAWTQGMLGLAAIVSFIFVLWSLSADYVGAGLNLPQWLYDLSTQTKATILFIAILVIVIWLVTRTPKGGQPRGNILDWIGERLSGQPRQP